MELLLVAVGDRDANLGLARPSCSKPPGASADARVETWVSDPLSRFLTESAARVVLLMTSAGQVVAQHGFTRAVDVMSAAALGAGIMASTEEMARVMGSPQFGAWCTRGRQGISSRGSKPPRAVDRAGGLRVGDVARDWCSSSSSSLSDGPGSGGARREKPRGPVLAENFEKELNASLRALFGR